MQRLKGKRALITGGTTGIGLETARLFVKEGARVAITGRDAETLDAARKELGDSVRVLSSNAGDITGQQKLADAIRDEFRELDILVINAGIGEFRPLGQWDEAAFDRSFAINLKGPFFLIQALLPVFANPASIVLNASSMPISACRIQASTRPRRPLSCH
jgi:NAD(P)-dependent dehydrogenase (short-subunit alcohol dehydrogenase family)